MDKPRNYNGVQMKTITVAQLRDLLDGQPDDMEVIFTTDYGDYSRTPQALALRGEVDTVTIEKSAYSNSGFAIQDSDAVYDDDGNLVDANDDYFPYLVIR
jgi:hypothetical protein